jgi:hypothetical protein
MNPYILTESTRHQERIKTLSSAVLRGWIKYPLGRAPTDCVNDGKELAEALHKLEHAPSDLHAREVLRRLGAKGLKEGAK